ISADQGKDVLLNIEDARGGNFNDTLIGTDSGNSLYGKDGDDSLAGGGGNDFLAGSQGNDTLAGNALGDFVEVSYEDAKVGAIINLTNVIHAGVAAHTAQDGLGGTDVLINIQGALGGDFGDQFFGADNVDDFFEPMGGNDTADGGGGTGFDEVDFFSSADAVTASLALQGGPQTISGSQGIDVYTGFEGLDGSAFNDTLIGDNNSNFLQGRAGADSLQGGDGDDRLRGGAGNDTLDGGFGFDQVDYFAAAAGVHVDLSKQGIAQVISKDQGSDTLLNFEDARGSGFNDTLIGNSDSNNLFGIDGNDSLNGGDGFDFLVGGKGNDTLNGGPAGDFDEVSYFDSTNPVIANLSSVVHQGVAPGTVQDGTGGTDRLINIGDILGGQGNDTMYGGAASEIFEASGGNDSIDGGGGFNVLDYFNSSDGVVVDLTKEGQAQPISASQGTDTFVNISGVYGSTFNDTIIGNNADNIAFGRDGNDRFAVAGSGVVITQQDVFDKFYSIEEIDLTGTGNNSLAISAQDVLQTSETGQMLVLGNAGDSVTSIGQGWNKGADQMIEGQTYHTYTSSQPGTTVTLLVDNDITQTIT
ncbi:MAG TPA: calcium-binding protein, partial [Bradyrhizobium sp.]|nr:calcium-binding protein [Bradyrhizobium sp.]